MLVECFATGRVFAFSPSRPERKVPPVRSSRVWPPSRGFHGFEPENTCFLFNEKETNLDLLPTLLPSNTELHWSFFRGVLSGGPLVGWGFQPGDPGMKVLEVIKNKNAVSSLKGCRLIIIWTILDASQSAVLP